MKIRTVYVAILALLIAANVYSQIAGPQPSWRHLKQRTIAWLRHSNASTPSFDSRLQKQLDAALQQARKLNDTDLTREIQSFQRSLKQLGSEPLRVAGTATISGSIKDAKTLSPLPYVYVELLSDTGDTYALEMSDAAGQYQIANVQPGTYYLKTWGDDTHTPELYDNITCLPAYCDALQGTAIPVPDGNPITGKDFLLDTGGSISGKVVSEITGLPVQAYLEAYDDQGYVNVYGQTNALGEYVMGFPEGQYYLLTWDAEGGFINELYDNIPCPGYSCDPLTGNAVAVTGNNETAGIDFALTPGGTISGTVTGSDTGLPIEDASLDFYSSDFGWADTSTNANGDYAISGLTPGDYYLRVSQADGYLPQLYNLLPCVGACDMFSGNSVSVDANSVVQDINFVLDPAGRLEGIVTDSVSATPLAGIYVSITDHDHVDHSTQTDGLGRYAFRNLPTGTYFVYTQYSEMYIDEIYNNVSCENPYECPPEGGDGVAVTAGATTSGIDFQLDRKGSISGTVTQNGVPLAFAGIYIRDAVGNVESSAQTNGLGRYSVIGLYPGTYYAYARKTPIYLDQIYSAITCINAVCDPLIGTPIPVTIGNTTSGIDFDLVPGGEISGTVTDHQTGIPVKYAAVRLYGDDFSAHQMTDWQGWFYFVGLRPGTYYAVASHELYMDELYNGIPCEGGCTPSSGTPIVVSLSGSTTVDFQLQSDALFVDLFEDDQLSSGWTYKGTWQEIAEMLVSTASRKATAIAAPVFAGCSVCTVRASIFSEGGVGNQLSLFGWYQDANNYVELIMKEDVDKWVLRRRVNGVIQAKKGTSAVIEPGWDYYVALSYDGANVTATVDGTQLLSIPASTPPQGTVGFKVKATTGWFQFIDVE